MAAILYPSYQSRPMTGILLPTPPLSMSSSQSSASTSSSSASSSSSHTSISISTKTKPTLGSAPRRIRFAPLPDPRSVLITDDGGEPPFSDHETAPPMDTQDSADTADNSSIHSSKRTFFGGDVSSTSSSSPSSTSGATTPLSTTTAPSSEDHASVSDSPVTTLPTRKSLTKSWLKSFRRTSPASTSSSGSSTLSLTPTPSLDPTSTPIQRRSLNSNSGVFSCKNFSTEEILTLGTINLFRTSSRSSINNDTESTTGWGLQRWTSAGSTGIKNKDTPGSPLARSQSSQSYTQSSTGSRSPFLSASVSLPSTQGPKSVTTLPRKQGTRMLNGRVYGGPRSGAGAGAGGNPFANIKDDSGPDFVEWGYGGMGSVKGASSAGVDGKGVWGRVQSQNAAFGGGEDDEDGSGMGWVKRRREEKQRKEKERKEAEEKQGEMMHERATEATTALAIASPMPPLTTTNSTANATITPANVGAVVTVPTPPAEEQHVLHAVNIPAPIPRHHHHRNHSRGNSNSNVALNLGLTIRELDCENVEGEKDKEGGVSVMESMVESHSMSSSESDSEDEDDRENDTETEDEDEDNEGEDAGRKTALGAGVEKISRHKELEGTAVGVGG